MSIWWSVLQRWAFLVRFTQILVWINIVCNHLGFHLKFLVVSDMYVLTVCTDINAICTKWALLMTSQCSKTSPSCTLPTTVSSLCMKGTLLWLNFFLSFFFCMWHNLTKTVMQNICPVRPIVAHFLKRVAVWQIWHEMSRTVSWWSRVHHVTFFSSLQRNYHMPKRRIWACTKSWTRPCRSWTAYKHTERKMERMRSLLTFH